MTLGASIVAGQPHGVVLGASIVAGASVITVVLGASIVAGQMVHASVITLTLPRGSIAVAAAAAAAASLVFLSRGSIVVLGALGALGIAVVLGAAIAAGQVVVLGIAGALTLALEVPSLSLLSRDSVVGGQSIGGFRGKAEIFFTVFQGRPGSIMRLDAETNDG